jgi:hypothetical protein
VIGIGSGQACDSFYNRTVRVVRLSGGAGLNLQPSSRPAAVEARATAATRFADGGAHVGAVAR